MSRKKSLVQADKTQAQTPAILAMQMVNTPEHDVIPSGKQPKPWLEDEDDKTDKAALAAEDAETTADAEGDVAGNGGGIHLAEVAGAPASDAPPAAAGSVPASAEAGAAGSGAVAAGGTAMGELGIGLLIAGGVIGVAVAAGGGGGDAAAAAPATVVSGTLVGGPVVAGNELTVNLYQADGTTTIKDASNNPITATLAADGSFTVDIGSYTGVVIAKAVDAGAGADYIDEATGQAVDLAANLMAMGIASGGTLTLNINPLTTVAVLAAGANPDATDVTDTNAAVAQAFGLSDLTGTEVITTVNASGAANGEYGPTAPSNAEQYGAVLAALSGMDQAGDAQATIDTLVANLTINGASGSLNTAALNALMAGAATADGNTTGNLQSVISDATAKSSASVGIDTIATDNVIDVTEAGVGVTLTGTNVADATVRLSIGGTDRDATVTGTTWSYTLQAADYTAMGEGGETITATATTGSGATAVTSTATRAINIDTAAPTLTIASNDTALKSGETATLTFTFSEPPSDFIAADITASGGTLSGLTRTTDAKVYTATFTPTPNTASATASIFVNDNTYTDAAGNNGAGADAPAISIDTLTPTVGIGSDVAAVKIGETATITFTFSEDPGASFVWDGIVGDVVVSGGTLSAISGSDLTRTATFTPTVDFEGNASITLAAGAYTDAAGNNGGAGATPAIAIDTLAPTLVISSNDAALKIGETATITFTFSSAPTGFDAGDVAATGGSLSNLAVSADPKVYTATFTPTADFEGSASISVAAATYTDAAGNAGGAGATPAITVDTAAPSIAIGNIAVDNVINATEYAGDVTISGSSTGAEDGQTVTVNLNGKAYTGAVAGDAWSVTVPAGDVGVLADLTTYPVTANVSDLAGNPAAQASKNVLVAISGPVININAMAGDNFINATEYGDELSISGTVSGADGQTLTVHLNGQAYTSVVAAGAWSVMVDAATMGALADATYPVTADVSDSTGNPAQQASLNLIIDTIIATPTVALANDNGGSGGDDLSNDASLTTSAAAADVSRTFTVDGGAASATYTAPTTDGSHTVVVTDTDTAGNTANASVTFTLDQTLAIPTLALSNDTGSSNADRITSDASLTFSAAAADVTRTFTVDGGAATGSYTAPTTDGSHTVVVTDTDNAGNTTNASLTFTLDNSIATPTVALANDNGSSNSDGLSNDASLSLSATAADVSRTFAVDGGTASATYTAPTTDGSHTVLVTDTDTAGNTANASLTFTLDTTLATPTLGLINDTGASNVDRITSDASLTASSINPDIARTFTVDGGAATGSYTAPTTDGDHTVVVTDIDPAGNTRSASLTFTRDTTAPTQTVSGVDISADTGSDATDFNTSTAAQTITGTLNAALAAGDTLYGSVDDGANWTDITDKANGTAISWDGATLAGSDTIGFRITDQAGNSGATTGSQDYVLDTTAPSFTSPASAVFPDQGTGTAYTAVASDANAVSYSLAGTDAGLFDIDANSGAVTFKAPPSTAAPADAGGDNVYNIDVTATDLAGLSTTQAVAISVVNAPTLQASALDDVTNFEVTSNIVLNYSESIAAVAGKYIHIVNDGGTGFRGESTVHTQDILVTDATQVGIADGKVTLNPTFDLDLANTYHIMIDAGAFTGTSSNLATAAYDGSSNLNFATVTPGNLSLAAAVQSRAMDASGTMVNGHQWLDIEGIGNPLTKVSLDLATGNSPFALVAKDYDPAGADRLVTGYDGIAVGDFNIAAINFGADDLFYIDDQANNPAATNELGLLTVNNNEGLAPTTVTLSSTSGASFIDITLAGLTQGFGSIADMETALGITAAHFISA